MVDAEIRPVQPELFRRHRKLDRSSLSPAERVCDCGEGVQCPKDRSPIFMGAFNDRRGGVNRLFWRRAMR